MSAEPIVNEPAELRQQAQDLGRALFAAVHSSSDGPQLLEKTKEVFWGLSCEARLGDFDRIWSKLRAASHTRLLQSLRRPGDVTLWAESRGELKVLVVIDHTSALPDNTTVYILRRPEAPISEEFGRARTEFRVLSAWPRAKRSGYRFGDHRDILQPSLMTLSGSGYRYGHGDFRDPCHVLSMRYAQDGPSVAHASATEEKIGRALSTLEHLAQRIDEYLRLDALLRRT